MDFLTLAALVFKVSQIAVKAVGAAATAASVIHQANQDGGQPTQEHKDQIANSVEEVKSVVDDVLRTIRGRPLKSEDPNQKS